jgi:hypothetical protein
MRKSKLQTAQQQQRQLSMFPCTRASVATCPERGPLPLKQDLRDLPRNSAVRKINELVKRARLAKVNAHVISHLKAQMPMMLGQKKKQEALLADLGAVFRQVMKVDALSPGDFPDVAEFRAKLAEVRARERKASGGCFSFEKTRGAVLRCRCRRRRARALFT